MYIRWQDPHSPGAYSDVDIFIVLHSLIVSGAWITLLVSDYHTNKPFLRGTERDQN